MTVNTRILCLIGDPYHPASEMREGLDNALRTHDISYSEDPAALDAKLDYSLLIITKSGMGKLPGEETKPWEDEPWLTPARDEALLEYVREGGGLLLIHSGLSRQESDRHRLLAGGFFLHHPPACGLSVTAVNNHPISAEVPPFSLDEEQYFCSVDIGNTKPILVSNTQKHGAVVAGWTHTFGSGRVCALTPGHNAQTLKHPQMVRLIRNAVSWCAESAQSYGG